MEGAVEKICTRCLVVGQVRRVTRGSLLIELILWLVFIVPGLIYSIWRLTTRYAACKACGSTELVPVSSPRGQQLLQSRAPVPVAHVVSGP